MAASRLFSRAWSRRLRTNAWVAVVLVSAYGVLFVRRGVAGGSCSGAGDGSIQLVAGARQIGTGNERTGSSRLRKND